MKRLIILLTLAAPGAHAAADADRGKALHDKHCMQCHDTKVYTRENRFIDSRAALQKQVQRCQLNAGARWFDEDVNDVVEYLNQTFYHYE
jgi:cytochrome c2